MNAIADALLRGAVQGTIGVAAVWLVVRAVPRLPAAWRVWLWRLAALKFVLALAVLLPAPILAPAASPVPRPELGFSFVAVGDPVLTDHGARISIRNGATGFSPPSGIRSATPAPTDPRALRSTSQIDAKSINLPLEEAAVALWLAGLVIAICRLMAGARQSRAIRNSLAESAEGHAVAARLSRRLKLMTVPTVAVYPGAGSPMLLGVVRPVIVLHSGLEGAAREMAIAHELAHVKRRDAGWLLAMRLVAALFWVVPPLHWAVRASAQAAEEACDALAMQVTGQAPDSYARLLLAFTGDSRVQIPALCLSPSARNLARRIQSVYIPARSPRHVLCAAALVVASLALLPWTAVARQASNVPAPGPTTGSDHLSEMASFVTHRLELPEIQRELHMSSSQVAKLDAIDREFDTWSRSFRPLMCRAGTKNQQAYLYKISAPRGQAWYRDRLNVLEANQKHRAGQLAFQLLGENALGREPAAREIGLTAQQRNELLQLEKESMVRQRAHDASMSKRKARHFNLARLSPSAGVN